MDRRFRMPAFGAVVVMALLLSACAGGSTIPDGRLGSGRTAGSVAGAGDPKNAADTAAAIVRAKLTALLREDVDLVAFTVQTAKASGFQSEPTRRAIQALHHSGKALVDLIAAVHGRSDTERDPPSEIERLRSHWKEHVEYLVRYIEGAIHSDEALKSQAASGLFETEAKIAEVIADLTEDVVTVEEAHGLLGEHLGATLAMIDAIAKGEQTAPKNVLEAARRADDLAKEVAYGFDIDPTPLSGSVIGEAAALRAHLTGLLVQHVGQTVTVAHVATATGVDSERTATAVEALRANMDELVRQIESVYGKTTAEKFHRLFERHLTSLVEYAKARAEAGASVGPPPTDGPTEPTEAGLPGSLADFPRTFTDFAVAMTGGELAAQKFEHALTEQLTAVVTAIDEVAKTGVAAAQEVETAESAATHPAKLLAIAIVEQLPDRFR